MADELRQYQARAQGRIYAGPYSAGSGEPKNTVMEITIREMPFADSTSAVRFMDHVGRKYPSWQTTQRSRALRQSCYENDD
jgi:hypothetical protein